MGRGRTDGAGGGGGSAGLQQLEPDAAALERLLGDGVPLPAGLKSRPLHGVDLQEAVEELRVAPAALVVVEPDLAGRRVEDRRVEPAGQPEEQPGGLVGEEL